MADISDIEQAVVDAVTAVLYPAGPSQRSSVGTLCRTYRGWPNSATLNADLNAGTVNVTIAADNDSGRTTTRYLPKWETTSVQPGAAASVDGQSVTISGVPTVGDVVGIMADGDTFAYRIRAGDSPGLVAASLVQLIVVTRIASLHGSMVTIPGTRSIVVRVVRDKVASIESRRQEKDLRIALWCPTPLVRDCVATAIDAGINRVGFLPLSDTSHVRIAYRNTTSYDQAQNALLYRRDLIYTVEYPTVTTILQPSMLFGASDLNSNIIYG